LVEKVKFFRLQPSNFKKFSPAVLKKGIFLVYGLRPERQNFGAPPTLAPPPPRNRPPGYALVRYMAVQNIYLLIKTIFSDSNSCIRQNRNFNRRKASNCSFIFNTSSYTSFSSPSCFINGNCRI